MFYHWRQMDIENVNLLWCFCACYRLQVDICYPVWCCYPAQHWPCWTFSCNSADQLLVSYCTWSSYSTVIGVNKADLRDLIAAIGLVILLKLDLNCRFFSPSDLEIWWMTQKNNRTPLLCYSKLFASFRSHSWIQTRVTVQKRLIWFKIKAFF